MLNNNYVFKEFPDLNGHYLKISLYNGDIHIVSYNMILLNGIKYETQITKGEMLKKSQSQSFSTPNLFDLILKKIGEKKYTIKSDQSSVIIILLETSNILNKDRDIHIVIPKNNNHRTTDYEVILTKEVFKLRNEINKLNNLLKLNHIQNDINDKRQSVQLNKSSIVFSPSNMLKTPKNENNINNININNSLKPQKSQPIAQPKGDTNNLLNTQILNIEALSKLEYTNYPKVQKSSKPFSKIVGFGANSFQGITRDHNEDRLKVIYEHIINLASPTNGKIINHNVSFFAIYDGHGGNKCCTFLQQYLHNYMLQSEYFLSYPLKAIEQAYDKAELSFESMALDKQNKTLLDKSGSCSLTALIIDDWCFVSFLGDSRGLYSFDGGKQLFQITRDHKPADMNERLRIEKAGGKIYKDTRLKINGLKVRVKEKDVPGVKFPCRVSPGNLSVRLNFNFIYIGCQKYWRFWV